MAPRTKTTVYRNRDQFRSFTRIEHSVENMTITLRSAKNASPHYVVEPTYDNLEAILCYGPGARERFEWYIDSEEADRREAGWIKRLEKQGFTLFAVLDH